MVFLGILIVGVVYELNNFLNYIVGGYIVIYDYFNEDEVIDKVEIEEYFDWIKVGVDRVIKIVKSLNFFSRSNEDDIEVCDLYFIIDDCFLMF